MFESSRENELRNILDTAQKTGSAVGQFNFSTLEQLKGITMAAKETGFPVICGTSSGEADFIGMEEAVSLVRAIRQKESIPIFLNFDHGKDIKTLKTAIDLGYDMVHFDGSKFGMEENIEKAREVVSYARKKNIVVEGEVSIIGGKSVVSSEKIEDSSLTSLEKVVKFIKKTEVDCIALGVGNVHGIHRNSPRLYPERITQLLDSVPCLVALHGGSGISKEDLKDMIGRGVTKININTEIRVAWKEALEGYLRDNPDDIVPYKILSVARDAVNEKVKEKIKSFNN